MEVEHEERLEGGSASRADGGVYGSVWSLNLFQSGSVYSGVDPEAKVGQVR